MRTFDYSLSLLHVDYVRLDKRWNFKNVISPYYRIYYIDAGAGRVWNASQSMVLEKGYLYMIPSFTNCNMECDHYMKQYFIQFFEDTQNGRSLFANNRNLLKVKAIESDVENFKRLLDINRNRGIKRSNNPRVYEKNEFYREYQNFNRIQNQGDFLETQAIMLQLMSKFLSEQQEATNTAKIPLKIMESINYILTNLHQQIKVKTLAALANQHPDYFSRVFEQFTGDRPLVYINEKRVERAQYLIITSQKSLEEIATASGFETMPYFFRMFKKFTGTTPTKYRLNAKTDGMI